MNESKIWPGYPYLAPLPVNYSKVGCPGISINSSGKVVSGISDSDVMRELDRFAEMMRLAKIEEDLKKLERSRISHEEWERQYKNHAAQQKHVRGDDLLDAFNTGKLMKPKK